MEAKTVIDAVNEFKGVWPYRNRVAMIYCHLRYCMYKKGDYDSFVHDDFSLLQTINWSPVCTLEEFNQCVEDCSNNFGKESIVVYTQAQCDAGELPSVGSEYLDGDGQLCKCLFNYKDLVTIGIQLEHPPVTSEFLSLSQTTKGEYKAITPPIELIDGKAYQFIAPSKIVRVGLYSVTKNEFMTVDGDIRSGSCVGIQLLEVK